MSNYTTFRSEWQGRRVDFDRMFAFQCVDLIQQFVYEIAHVTGLSGNAIDYANRPCQAFVNATVRVTDGSKQAGDILVFRSSTPDGHIALRDSDLDKMLEQNAADGNGSGVGRDAIGVYRNIPYDRLVAVYRLRALIAPAASPVLPQTNPAGKQLFLPSSAGPWRVYKTTGPYMVGHEIGKLMPQNFPPGLTYDIQGNPANNVFLIHTESYGQVAIYAGSDTPAQFHAIASPPPPPVYTPPAAPLPVPKAPQYTLVTTVMAFKTASDAANHANAQRTLKAGTYYVFNDPKGEKQYGMYNLTARADKPGDLDAGTGGWINPRDNVLPEPTPEPIKVTVTPTPAPTPPAPVPETAPQPVEQPKPQVSQVTTVALKPNEWKTTNVALRLDRQADIFYRRDDSDITVYDLDGSRPPITLKAYTLKDGMNEPTPIPIISTFWKDGVEYGRTPKAAKEGWWYGVPMSALDYGSATTIADRVANNTAKFGDRLAQIIGGVERLIQDVKARKAKK